MSEKTKGDKALRLRPRASIMRILGRELISSEFVALTELVKNSYDADAERVLVRFEGPLEVGKGSAMVIDDGHGMEPGVVKGAFLEPATPSKRGKDRRSPDKERRFVGAKGIGRFAAERIANELIVTTLAAGSSVSLRARFEWGDFDDEEKYLEDIDIEYAEAPAEAFLEGPGPERLVDHFGGDRPGSGTVLEMRGFRTRWERQDFEDIRRGLARLVSPFADEITSEFRVALDVPEPLSDLSGEITPPEVMKHPHYVLDADISREGEVEGVVEVRGTGEQHRLSGSLRRLESESDLRLLRIERESATGVEGGLLRCGPLRFRLYVWDRDDLGGVGQQLGLGVKQVREDLDQIAGISVYRNGFRVLPYGEPNDDWLRLDFRRVQFPRKRLSNNQIVGYVFIGADENPELRDQSNREGLEENDASRDLRATLLALMSELENRRYESRTSPENPPEDAATDVFEDLEKRVQEVYPEDTVTRDLLDSAKRTYASERKRSFEVISRYRRLATLGTLIDIVIHEGRQPVSNIKTTALLGIESLERNTSIGELSERLMARFCSIAESAGIIGDLFKRIEPLGGRKRGRPEKLYLEKVIESAFEMLRSSLDKAGIEVDLPRSSTLVTVDSTECHQIFLNLINNSLYWLKEVPGAERRIAVEIQRKPGEYLDIIFSDSGPGVREEARERLFEPFASWKPDGTGLGLAIVGEIVESYYDGTVELLDHGPLPGATFRIRLRRRV